MMQCDIRVRQSLRKVDQIKVRQAVAGARAPSNRISLRLCFMRPVDITKVTEVMRQSPCFFFGD